MNGLELRLLIRVLYLILGGFFLFTAIDTALFPREDFHYHNLLVVTNFALGLLAWTKAHKA